MLTEATGEIPALLRRISAPRVSAEDVDRLAGLGEEEAAALLYRATTDPTQARLKVYRTGHPLTLSIILPLLATTGVEVVDEQAYELSGHPWPAYLYDFGLRHPQPIPDAAFTHLQDALEAVWHGLNEADGFNALVLAAGLTWRQATVLRAIAKYLRQGGSPFAQDYIEETLLAHPRLTALLVDLFEARFDPLADKERQQREEQLTAEVLRGLDDVASLDHDRILRSFLAVVRAMLRTNHFQTDDDGSPRAALAIKLRPGAIPDLPQPRPLFEIFVCSPRVEGVHLRFGAVARGGLRWSDRREDFRTEVLGLVKAQMVKNTVIVPVGAKGGFFCKQLPPSGDRDAWLAEGIACYRTFIAALLDVTDNIVDGEVVPPRAVVRHDEDDPYLVVAADKGTATFSDIANEVSAEYGFWLGDAFASGGSAGYDHKAMGITARGAWESVKRHFREMGVDCQEEDFTCTGIGDMSGDVFGNGMLLSRHIRLVAAFDHRDVFLDPMPDAASSYDERARLFGLPRSSWQDYDRSVISTGGGVYPRSAKSIPLNDAVRRALSIPDVDGRPPESMTPNELIRAILRADVDLLWNGGIGTYVKASVETHTDVGDRANDAIRVDGHELRARCVGEGGNLGLTQRGRIEYAVRGAGGEGGRINTDFIDNSAGVDTSDHEVNIKILLSAAELDQRERDELLASMTDEVAAQVLRDNDEQNDALAMSAIEAARQAPVHQDWMRRLEARGVLDRRLEQLPSSKELAKRIEDGVGLTVPELSVLLAYTKIALADELLTTDLPDHPFLRGLFTGYFPAPLRDLAERLAGAHPLRREIVTTQAVNGLVNGTGTTYFHRLSEETGAGAGDLLLASFAAREVFGSQEVLEEIAGLDNLVPAQVQTQMRAEIRDLVERAARWLVYNGLGPREVTATVESFAEPTRRVLQVLPSLFGGREREAFESRRDHLVTHGVDEALATRVAAMVPAYTVLTIVQVADRLGLDALEVARVHFTLGERLGLPAIGALIRALPREDRWQTTARASLREDIHSVHGELTAQVMAYSSVASPEARVDSWEAASEAAVAKATATLAEIAADESPGLAALSVAVRVLRSLLETMEEDVA